MELLRKYGVATTIIFPLVSFSGDLNTSPTLAAGDAKIIKDEGAAANTTNTMTDETSGFVSISLTATEMQAARIAIACVDQTATKNWRDTAILISTYGNASAQHPFDLGTASTPQTGDNYARLGAPAGASVSADIAGVQSDTNDIQTRIPAALVSGRIDASVGAVAANAITAASIATGAIDADALATDAVAEIADGVWDEAIAGHLTAGSTGVTLNGASAPSAATIADAVWDEAQSGHTTAGTFGKYLDTEVSGVGGGTPPTAAAIADAVWDEATAGHTTAGTFGAQAKTVIDAIQTDTDAIEVDTQDIQGRLPAALVSGRIDAIVGAVAANAITAASIATGAVDADALAADAVTEIAAGISIPSAATIADAVWDEAQAGHVSAGTFGLYLDTEVSGVGGGSLTETGIADAILSRPISNVEGTAAFRTLAGAIAKLVNRVRVNGSSFEVYKTNDTDLMGTQTATTDAAAEPIKELNTD